MTAANSTYYDHLNEIRPFGWEFNGYRAEPYAFEELDYRRWERIVHTKWHWAVYTGVLYVVLIFCLQHYMKSRPAFELKWPLFLWNFGLGVFSIVGFTRAAPTFLYVLPQPNGVFRCLCIKNFFTPQMAFWLVLFAFSKVVELGDTVFIVLRKRPLVFLQWFHHAITLIYVWALSPYVEPAVCLLTLINYLVHALMYPYFALRAIDIRVPTKVANFITTLQFVQMVFAIFVNLLTVYLHHAGYNCDRHPTSVKFTLFVFSCFVILFGKLFYESVIQGGRIKKEKLKKQ